ncbi:MAG: glycosidase [Lentisphaerae bacterium]|nr:glycosidase [Lentisphaerota bacterium]MBR2719781.1 glycosidase [Lentisphaeria bacterium]
MTNPFRRAKYTGPHTTSPIIRRYEGNPLFTAKDVPYDVDLVYNAGVTFFNGRYCIAPRVDCADPDPAPGESNFASIHTGLGWSDDGINFDIEPEFIRVHYKGGILPWVCDTRLTVLEGELYITFCFENQHSERPGIAKWRGKGVDFDAVWIGIPQQRNMVLYPEKINGMYMRMERPSNQWGDPFHIWYAFSPDLRYWGDQELLLGCEDVPFASIKIGAGAPPVKTDKGWLLIFHAVDGLPAAPEESEGRGWTKRYMSGAALFDLEDPTRLIAITKEPLLCSEMDYETGKDKDFWVQDTVFPCGAVIEEDGETLRIYYGAGDTNTCLATTTLTELWSVMTPAARLAETATIPFRYQDWVNNAGY